MVCGAISPSKKAPSALTEETRVLQRCFMTQTLEAEYEDRSFAETPFVEPRYESYESYEGPQRENGAAGEAHAPGGGPWNFETPFETMESFESGAAQAATPEVAAMAELLADARAKIEAAGGTFEPIE